MWLETSHTIPSERRFADPACPMVLDPSPSGVDRPLGRVRYIGQGNGFPFLWDVAVGPMRPSGQDSIGETQLTIAVRSLVEKARSILFKRVYIGLRNSRLFYAIEDKAVGDAPKGAQTRPPQNEIASLAPRTQRVRRDGLDGDLFEHMAIGERDTALYAIDVDLSPREPPAIPPSTGPRNSDNKEDDGDEAGHLTANVSSTASSPVVVVATLWQHERQSVLGKTWSKANLSSILGDPPAYSVEWPSGLGTDPVPSSYSVAKIERLGRSLRRHAVRSPMLNDYEDGIVSNGDGSENEVGLSPGWRWLDETWVRLM